MDTSILYPFAVLLLHRICDGLMVPWKSCPEISLGYTTDYDCDLWQYVWRLVPLAHIPGGATSMTLFHNPYHGLNCVQFDFFCRKDSYIFGDLYLTSVGREQMVCPGFGIMLGDNRWQLKLDTNPNSKECQTVKRWLSLDIFAYQQNEYIFVYGCWQQDENLPIAIGAWILGSVNATEEKRATILQSTRELAKKIPGFRDDWWFYPQSVDGCSPNETCEYLADCKLPLDVEEIQVPFQSSSLTAYLVLVPLAFGLVILCCYAVFKSLQSIKVSPA